MILIAQKKDSGLELAVSDPTHKLKDGVISFSKNMELKSADKEVTVSSGKGSTAMKINFENSSGKTISASLLGDVSLPGMPDIASAYLQVGDD